MTAIESISDSRRPDSHLTLTTPAGYELTLELVGGLARITLSGTLDESAADAVGGMVGIAGAASGDVEIVANGVSVVDPTALDLLVAAARERRQHRRPAVVLTSYSLAMKDALRSAGFSLALPISLCS